MLQAAVKDLPAGRWAVGVSGGADSVALLLLLQTRSDLTLLVTHLDHETRGGESGVDATFVEQLAAELGLPCKIAKRSMIESSLSQLSKNTSDRYRQARVAFFSQTVAAEQLQGVVLAHHADDQAETILMRVLRGSAGFNLGGMQTVSKTGGLLIARPLLNISSDDLRTFLRGRGRSWREDSSNQSPQFLRNRLRFWLNARPALRDSLLRLGKTSQDARSWLGSSAPALAESFPCPLLNNLPPPLARFAAARWLVAQGTPPVLLSDRTCNKLIQMSTDAAAPSQQHFPGALLISRKRGILTSSRN